MQHRILKCIHIFIPAPSHNTKAPTIISSEEIDGTTAIGNDHSIVFPAPGFFIGPDGHFFPHVGFKIKTPKIIQSSRPSPVSSKNKQFTLDDHRGRPGSGWGRWSIPGHHHATPGQTLACHERMMTATTTILCHGGPTAAMIAVVMPTHADDAPFGRTLHTVIGHVDRIVRRLDWNWNRRGCAVCSVVRTSFANKAIDCFVRFRSAM